MFRMDFGEPKVFPDPACGISYDDEPLRLSYHMHDEFAGGEHYNSLITAERRTSHSSVL